MIIDTKVGDFLLGNFPVFLSAFDNVELVADEDLGYLFVGFLVDFGIPLFGVFEGRLVTDVEHEDNPLCFFVVCRRYRSVGLCAGLSITIKYTCVPYFDLNAFSMEVQ